MAIDPTRGRKDGAALLRLVASYGAILPPEMTTGTAANGGEHRPISEVEAYERVIAETVSVRRGLNPTSGAWRDLGHVLVELERSISIARAQCE